jgi:glycosyltransferase involved in cell wall biosynthesis
MLTSLSYWHYRHVDKIIALSESMKHHLIHKVGVPENRVTVIPQAAEKIYEKNIYDKTLARRFRNGFTILYAGNISPAQSFGTIIQAAKRLRSEGLKDINWVIVGDGMSRKEVEQAVKNEGLTDIFYFEGHKPVEAMPRYNYHADLLIGCLVKSKLLEATIPAKVMSYIAAGRPIVLAMDGEVRNLINSTIRCGFAGPTCDPVQLSENIKKLYSLSSNQRKEFGENAKSYHFQNFERNILLNKMFSFILEKRE